MSIQFTEEQIALRDLARDFFEKEVRPVAAAIDARPDPKDCYPGELVKKMSKIGLRTLALPEEYGGANADVVTKALLLMTMCEVEAGTAKIMSQCWKVSQVIVEAGTEYQKKKFLREFAADDEYTTSILMTEPNAGSDNILPYNAPGAGVAVTAVPDGGSGRRLLYFERHQDAELPGELFEASARLRPDRLQPSGPPGHIDISRAGRPSRHHVRGGAQ
jgi:alkylation response protein AidB-like acyl-CoA dehydrogenase